MRGYISHFQWFSNHSIDLDNDATGKEYESALKSIKPLIAFLKEYMPELEAELVPLYAEFVLHALAEYSLISKKSYHGKVNFNDMLGSLLS